MKKCLFLLLILFGLLAACTDSPTEPGVPGGGGGGTSGYTVTLTPATGSAFITGTPPPTEAGEIIEITATVKKDGAVFTDRVRVIFEIIGTGAAFVETGNAYYNTYTVNGAATATLYATATGTFTVKATAVISDNASATATKNYTFMDDPHPSIIGVSPATGTAAGGDTVTITGTGFVQPLEIYFGTQRAQFVSGTTTLLTVTTPIHYPSDCNANDVVDVRVVVFAGQTAETSVSLPNAFTYLFAPIEPNITGIDPNHGDTDGGTLITIYGSSFYCGEGVLVYFKAGANAIEVSAPVVSCAPDKLVVKSPPAHDMGIDNCVDPVSVRVLNLCGGLSYSLADSFKYGPDLRIAAFGPTESSIAGGLPLTIYGQGFDSPVAVTVAGVAAQVTSVSNNEILVNTGAFDPKGSCGNQSGPICVTDIECGVSACSDGSFTYIVPDVFVASIAPTQGVAGTTVTINGQGLFPPLEVFFGETNAAVGTVAADYTSMTVSAPTFPGPYDTLDCPTPGGGCPGLQDQPTPVDVTVHSLFTGCTYTFKSFYYVPPPADPLHPEDGAACVTAAPTCTMTGTFGVAPACTATFTVVPQCGATYDWSGVCGIVAGGSNIYTCAVTDADSPATGTVIITNEGGLTASCTASVSVTGCP